MAAAPKFAKTHEWIRLDDDGLATVGISAYAVEALTDLVFMQLPDVGRAVKAGEGTVELIWPELGKGSAKLKVMQEWLALLPEERHLSVPEGALSREDARDAAALIRETLRDASRPASSPGRGAGASDGVDP